MLQRNPEFPPSHYEIRTNRLPVAPPIPESELSLLEVKNYGRARKLISGFALATTLTGVPTYSIDVMYNTIAEDQAKPEIHVMAGPLHEEDSHKATIILNGFNTRNADAYTMSMGKSIQQYADGELWSVDYNNAPLNGKTIFESAYELAQQRGIISVSVASYSMGDIPAVEVAKDFVVNSPIPVEKIAVTSGPSGFGGLQPFRQKEMESAELWSRIPGVTHSTFGRYAAELYFYRDVYLKDGIFDFEKFWGVVTSTAERFKDGEYTSNSFLMSQIEALNNANIDDKFKQIAEHSINNPPPIMIDIRTGSPLETAHGLQGGHDAMVNDEISSEEFSQAAFRANIPYFKYLVDGAIHSEYYKSTKEFMESAEVTAKVVNPYAEARAQAFHDSLLNSYASDSLDPTTPRPSAE